MKNDSIKLDSKFFRALARGMEAVANELDGKITLAFDEVTESTDSGSVNKGLETFTEGDDITEADVDKMVEASGGIEEQEPLTKEEVINLKPEFPDLADAQRGKLFEFCTKHHLVELGLLDKLKGTRAPKMREAIEKFLADYDSLVKEPEVAPTVVEEPAGVTGDCEADPKGEELMKFLDQYSEDKEIKDHIANMGCEAICVGCAKVDECHSYFDDDRESS